MRRTTPNESRSWVSYTHTLSLSTRSRGKRFQGSLPSTSLLTIHTYIATLPSTPDGGLHIRELEVENSVCVWEKSGGCCQNTLVPKLPGEKTWRFFLISMIDFPKGMLQRILPLLYRVQNFPHPFTYTHTYVKPISSRIPAPYSNPTFGITHAPHLL